MIRAERVYDLEDDERGARYLVDRLWPRGIEREKLHLTEWLRDLAPSDQLRRWFDHDPARWREFKRRYFAELADKPETWAALLEAAKKRDVTLLFAAKDEAHNNAIALREFLRRRTWR